jgi:Transposase
VVRVANRCLDKVRRRVQNQTLGHRGRKRDPLYKIRKLLLKGAERLDGTGLDPTLLEMRLGDPDGDVTGAWAAKESIRDIYLTNNPADAELLLDKAIEGRRADWVEEIRWLGRTLARRQNLMEFRSSGASTGQWLVATDRGSLRHGGTGILSPEMADATSLSVRDLALRIRDLVNDTERDPLSGPGVMRLGVGW